MSLLNKVRIGDFLFERKGKYKPEDPSVSNLRRIEKIDFSGKIYISDKPSRTNMIIVEDGDFVISGINVAKGAMGIYRGKEPVAATIHYSSYTFDTSIIDINFFEWFLKSEMFVNLLKEQIQGGIKTEIKPKHLLPLEIEIPRIERQRILAKSLSSSFSNIQKLKEMNIEEKQLIERLRQRILDDAIKGGLTEEWRKENQNESQTSLKSIKYSIGNIGEFQLPPTWKVHKLIDIIKDKPRNGYSPKAVDYETSTKTLKLTATTSGRFIGTEYKYIDEEIDFNSPLWLENGDILIQRANSLDYVGVSAIFDGEQKIFIYPDLMMKIKVKEQYLTKYVHLVLSSPIIRNYFRNNASGAQKSMPKINQSTVKNTPIPIPPSNEQKAIVEKVEYFFNLIKIIEKRNQDNFVEIDLLSRLVFKEMLE